MNAFRIILNKECIDNLRDRRTIISSLALAVLAPVLLVGLMTLVLENALGQTNETLKLTVVGAEHAPSLLNYLERQNTELKLASFEKAEQAVPPPPPLGRRRVVDPADSGGLRTAHGER